MENTGRDYIFCGTESGQIIYPIIIRYLEQNSTTPIQPLFSLTCHHCEYL